MTVENRGPAVGKRGRGRPRQFDRNKAVEQAMRLFWDRGYEAATFDALVLAMAVSPSSFYNTFGSKEALYREAVDAYLAGPGCFFVTALAGTGNARAAFERLINATAEAYTDARDPAGCMISLAAVHEAPERGEIRDFMRSVRRRSYALMLKRLTAAVADGELSAETNITALAEFFETLFRGMAVRARDGATREELQTTGRLALSAWPAKPRSSKRDTKNQPVT